MIRLTHNPTFEFPAQINVAGEPVPVGFEFRALGRKRLTALLILTRVVERSRIVRAIEFVKLCWRARRIATVADLLDEVIVKWDGVNEPYSRANLRLLLQEYPGAHVSIYTAYLQGLNEARRKNSSASPAR